LEYLYKHIPETVMCTKEGLTEKKNCNNPLH